MKREIRLKTDMSDPSIVVDDHCDTAFCAIWPQFSKAVALELVSNFDSNQGRGTFSEPLAAVEIVANRKIRVNMSAPA
jgi:hypothetical protein